MIQISKEEAEYLIAKGFIKNVRGKYRDLIVLNKGKKAKRKKHYTTEPIAQKLKHVD